MPSVNLLAVLIGVSVNILSIYHPGKVTVSAGDKVDTLRARDGRLHVNSVLSETYECRADSFRVRVEDLERGYSGSLEAGAEGEELVLINHVHEEAYLASVVGAEMVPGAGLQALKAQAVLCRTFLFTAERHRGDAWDVCDLTHCQAYKGSESTTQASREAVNDTRDLIVFYQGEPARVYYHSTSGGCTARASSVWPTENAPYLCSVPDPYSQASPHHTWEHRISARDVAAALSLPHVSDVRVTRRAGDERVLEVEVHGSKDVIYPGWTFRNLLARHSGWNTIKSSWFEVKREGDGFLFAGHGLGHGVGLSQWGAAGMAAEGASFRQILSHYFPGTEVRKCR